MLSNDYSKINLKFQASYLLLAVTLLFVSIEALAVVELPANNHQVVTVNFDRSTPPSDTYIWRDVSGGYDSTQPGLWGRNSWGCTSATDSSLGSCPVKPVWSAGRGQETDIRLRFTERRSKQSVDLIIRGYRVSNWTGMDTCKDGESGKFVLHGASATVCPGSSSGNTNDSANITVYIPGTEMAHIPTGGVWEAKLVLRTIQWSPEIDLSIFSADITLYVTDEYNGAIYLPMFGNATPRVDLNLRTKPLSTSPGGEVSGQATLDMCLYDGYNSNNSWLKVTLSDLLSVPGRPTNVFSVLSDGNVSGNDDHRIDYQIKLHYNGDLVPVFNGVALTLSNVNTTPFRVVQLPSFPIPVVCTPAGLDLTVMPFAKLSKTSGHYSGILRVILTADTLAP